MNRKIKEKIKHEVRDDLREYVMIPSKKIELLCQAYEDDIAQLKYCLDAMRTARIDQLCESLTKFGRILNESPADFADIQDAVKSAIQKLSTYKEN